MAVVLEKTATAVASMAVSRGVSDGMLDDQAISRLRLIAPHVRRALQIGKVIDLHSLKAKELASTLDGLAVSSILVDGSGDIVWMNKAAQCLIESGKVVCRIGNRFSFNDSNVDRALRDRLEQVQEGHDRTSDGLVVTAVDGERWTAHILPLAATSRTRLHKGACAAIFIKATTIDAPHPIDALSRAFRLTVAELRVLTMIVEVGGVPDVAPLLGISETTVKSHLQRIYAKTGATRQADLVKIVAGYMSPLRMR